MKPRQIARFLIISLSSLLTGCAAVFAQTILSGVVYSENNHPVVYATIVIDETTLHTTTDDNGKFSIPVRITDSLRIITSALNYLSDTVMVFPDKPEIWLRVFLERKSIDLTEIMIAAGSFDLSDKKYLSGLRMVDVLTTPGTGGDLFKTISMLPGAQNVGEQEGLFVRGGTNLESKTYIDEMLAPNPFFSSLPGIKQRSRFPSFLFSGTYFSTGGFSARYGNALSSALLLETRNLPDSSVSRFHFSLSGLTAMHDHRWKQSSFGLVAEYDNQSVLNSVTGRQKDWKLDPRHGGVHLFYRLQNSRGGLLKIYSYFDRYCASVGFTDLNDTLLNPDKKIYTLANNNHYSLITFRQQLNSKWSLFAGTSYSFNDDVLENGFNPLRGISQIGQVRITATRFFHLHNQFLFGVEANYLDIYSDNSISKGSRSAVYGAPYAEATFQTSNDFVARIGLRSEYSSLLNDLTLAPRISLGYQMGNRSQISFTTGRYFQIPEEDYLLIFTETNLKPLRFEQSDHYIFNYQYNSKRRFVRIEAYYKHYDNLLLYDNMDTSNNGYGFARGIELFFRDRRMFRGFDYWISYTLLDTRRRYLDYPLAATPDFVATHTIYLVGRYLIASADLMLAGTVEFSSGRHYYNPSTEYFLSDLAPFYKNFSVSANYRFAIRGSLAQVGASIVNVFGIDNIFSFNYSDDGQFIEDIRSASKRSISVNAVFYAGRKYEKRKSQQ